VRGGISLEPDAERDRLVHVIFWPAKVSSERDPDGCENCLAREPGPLGNWGSSMPMHEFPVFFLRPEPFMNELSSKKNEWTESSREANGYKKTDKRKQVKRNRSSGSQRNLKPI
jgi:hypothetical protein